MALYDLERLVELDYKNFQEISQHVRELFLPGRVFSKYLRPGCNEVTAKTIDFRKPVGFRNEGKVIVDEVKEEGFMNPVLTVYFTDGSYERFTPKSKRRYMLGHRMLYVLDELSGTKEFPNEVIYIAG